MVFENSLDVNQDDPLKKCFEYARLARNYAETIQGNESTQFLSLNVKQDAEYTSKGVFQLLKAEVKSGGTEMHFL